MGGHPLVSDIWKKSHFLWPGSDFLQARIQALETLHPFLFPPTQLLFPAELHVGPACPMVQSLLAKMDASGIIELSWRLLFCLQD